MLRRDLIRRALDAILLRAGCGSLSDDRGGWSVGSRQDAAAIQLPDASRVFDVTSPRFGAKGDGRSDDRPAIQAALDACWHEQGGTVYLPEGVYELATFTSAIDGSILRCGAYSGPARSLRIVGAGAILRSALLATADKGMTVMLRLSGRFEDSLVEGVQFLHTHDLTARTTCALAAEGGAQNECKRLTVERCVFRDCSRTITAAGVDGLVLFNNQFLYSRGRDSGNTELASPNVGLWCFVNQNGQTSNVRVIANLFDGCTAASVRTNRNPSGLDGFVYGAARGWIIAMNQIRHAGVESIYLASRQPLESSNFPGVIAENLIDCGAPSGALDTTYGIRCDEGHVTIHGNRIVNAQRGILIDGGSLPGAVAGVRVEANSIEMAGSGRASFFGIALHTTADAQVSANDVYWATSPASSTPGVIGISLFQSPNAVVEANRVRVGQSGGTPVVGFAAQQTAGARFSRNSTERCTTAILEQQHPTGTAPTRVRQHDFISCASRFGGQLGSVVTDVQRLEFQPPTSSAAAYRILSRPELISGRLVIAAHDASRRSHIELYFAYGAYGLGGVITQESSLQAGGEPIIRGMRLLTSGNGKGDQCALDILLGAVAGAVVELTFSAGELPGLLLHEPELLPNAMGWGRELSLAFGAGLRGPASAISDVEKE